MKNCAVIAPPEGSTICIPLAYQPDMNEKPCRESYFYDPCTFCKCDSLLNKTTCTSQDDCDYSRGVAFVVVMKLLWKTVMSVPAHLQNLENINQENARQLIKIFIQSTSRIIAIFVRRQECYSDYGCLENKKCCQVVDCFSRCIDPTSN
ncbi:hypothetical protein NQ317_007159 [Molorchus minor]|uniref:WAP domain-containing protein n=1 Tax=Molorchus minor TaxID=1323400 RepID=A0ABQ9J5C5_9CUCU|nr:hypothetical protein NQ317_007159 [Molorchus minor]